MRSKRTTGQMLTVAVLYLQNCYSPLSYGEQLQLFYEQCYMITTCKNMILAYTAPLFILETAKETLSWQCGGGR